jgi:cytochrome P450
MSSPEPSDVRAATTHRDPYPYYARLAVERPFYREAADGAWVAASAEAVSAVLTHPACATRPADSVVPPAMAGSPAGDLYSRLVRINHGAAHSPLKSNVVTAIDSVAIDGLARETRQRATTLASAIEPERDRARLTQFIYALPAEVLTPLVGVGADRIADVGQWIGAFGAASSAAATGVPALTPELMAHGADGSAKLLALFSEMADRVSADDRHLLARMLRHAAANGWPDRAHVIGNAIGILAQGFAATSALIGHTLLAMARHDDIRKAVLDDPDLIGELVQEVVRCDPSTQSLPRFAREDISIAGQPVRRGDVIIVSLAAANRDPALNDEPNRLKLDRPNRRYLEFGVGPHACAGPQMASMIAGIALDTLRARELPLDDLADDVSYRPSAHIRMPVFTA